MKNLLLIIILIFCLSPCIAAAQNPFLDQGKDNTKTERSEKKFSPPSFLRQVPKSIAIMQKQLRSKMSAFGRDIKDKPFGSSFWLFLMLSFVYGIIHAMGPGHGKTVVTSYFMSRPGTVRDGILMANLIAFFHVSSAVVIILTIYIFFKTTMMSSFEEASPLLYQISYALLCLVGVYLLSRTIYELARKRHKEFPNPHDSPNRGGIFITALATGIVPCPGAAIILIFTIIIGIFSTGLLSMLFIAVGMGLTISVAAVVTILSRRAVFHVTESNPKIFIIAYSVVSFTGSILLISLSIMMLLYYLM
jgi:ABC-type nickel/cobalt efflux system permease component RcnA